MNDDYEITVDTETGSKAAALVIAMWNMKDDEEVCARCRIDDTQALWEYTVDIILNGPQNDMERRIIAVAMARRLEGK